jgi:lysophospholipase L1-like esterase
VILLLIGTNDILEDSMTPAADLDSLIDQIYSQLPGVSLVVSTLPPLGSPKNQEVIAYNSFIPGIVSDHASQGRQIDYVDIYSVMSTSDLVDGIHPGSAGYSKMATVWFNKLMEILSVPGAF